MADPAPLQYDWSTGQYTFRDPSTAVINNVTGQTALDAAKKTPAVISTADGVEALQKKSQTLQQYAPPPTPPPTTTPPPTDTTKTTPPKQTDATKTTFVNPATEQEYTFNSEDLKNQANIDFIKNNKLDFMSGSVPDWMTTSSNETSLQKQYENAVADFDTMTGSLDTLLEKYGITDASLARQVEGIKNKYETRKSDMKRVNDSRTGALTARGFRSGSSQYSADFAGIISEEERQGIQRIRELDSQMDQEIQAAQDAQRTTNWKVFSSAVDRIEKRRAELATALKDYSKTVSESNTKTKERADQIQREEAISKLIGGNISDPNTIFSSLNALGYDVTSKEVKDTLSALTTNGDSENLTNDIKTFNYLKDNKLLPSGISSLPEEDQYFAYLNMQKLADSGKLTAAGKIAVGSGSQLSVGVGAKNQAEETIVRSRLFSKLMNILNKGTVSDSDRKIIDETISTLRTAGYSEQDIMDNLSGFATDVKTPYNDLFRDLIVSNTKDLATQNDAMGKVSMLLNSGNTTAAMKTVENLGFDRAKEILGTGADGTYLSNGTAQIYLNRINRIKKIADEHNYSLVSGTFQGLLMRLKSEGATELSAELANLYATFRKENLGSAVTPSEAAFLAPLFAQIGERGGNFSTKLDVFERGVMDRYNATRRAVSLPEATIEQARDDGKRLSLYARDSNPFIQSSKPSGSGIINSNGQFMIPTSNSNYQTGQSPYAPK